MSAYDDGMKDCKEGKQFYENPHVLGSSKKDDFAAWFAGWCLQKQIEENSNLEKNTNG